MKYRDRQNPPVKTICIIEDEPVQRSLLEGMLSAAGYAVVCFESADGFRPNVSAGEVDLLLLDWHLPGQSGLDLTRQLRQTDRNPLPVIFVTTQDDEEHMVEALDAGADDYLVKPVSRAELLARVRATLRRSLNSISSRDSHPPYQLNRNQRQVVVDGRVIRATPKEFDLLAFLFLRQGQPCSRQALLAHVWKTRVAVPTRTIDTHISRLKKKFQLDGRHGWLLEGLYQQGYRLFRVGQSVEEDEGGAA